MAYSLSNPLIVYARVESNSGEVYRSTDGGVTYSLVNTGRNYLGSQGWYDNIVWVDPTNSNNVIVGGIFLWRSTNAKAPLPNWTAIKSPIGANISAIAVKGNSDIIWVGHNNGQVYFTTNGTAATPTWTRVDTNGPTPGRFCTRIRTYSRPELQTI